MTYLYCRKVHILTSECYISLQKILLNTGASHTTSPPVFFASKNLCRYDILELNTFTEHKEDVHMNDRIVHLGMTLQLFETDCKDISL